MTDLSTVIHLLDEARGFAALSPAGRENISEAIDILEAVNTRPAAPVEGLDTVAWLKLVEHTDLEGDNFTSADESYRGADGSFPVVTRSQSEAIIAAERERADAVHKADAKAFLSMNSRYEKAEADNAALTARVKELEGEVFHDADLGITWKQICEQFDKECQHHQQRAEIAEDRVKELEETVRDDITFAKGLKNQLAAAKKALRNIAEDEGAPFRIKVHALATLEIIYDPH